MELKLSSQTFLNEIDNLRILVEEKADNQVVKDSLNQLTQHYFKKSMSLGEFVVTIPTSEIVELAVKYNLTKKEFLSFEQELRDLCLNR